MKKKIITTVKILVGLYLVLCMVMYFEQEKLLFHPDKWNADSVADFNQPYEEMSIKTKDGKKLSGLLFKAEDSKGLVFYLHGNGGNIWGWPDIVDNYANLNYDVFMLDYRGYGKSEGSIDSQNQLFEDVQIAYNELLKRYKEKDIVVAGYSIGTGIATHLASENNPKQLILQAPYYSLTDMMQHTVSMVPTFILKYPIETNVYIQQCKMPVTLFHGTNDKVIYYGSSLKLKPLLKPKDKLIPLEGKGHKSMITAPEYRMALAKILLCNIHIL